MAWIFDSSNSNESSIIENKIFYSFNVSSLSVIDEQVIITALMKWRTPCYFLHCQMEYWKGENVNAISEDDKIEMTKLEIIAIA